MWIYPARLIIFILVCLQPITPCPPPSLWRRAVISILRLGSQGPYCRSFRFSHAPAPTIDSTAGLLVGCSEGQFAKHW